VGSAVHMLRIFGPERPTSWHLFFPSSTDFQNSVEMQIILSALSIWYAEVQLILGVGKFQSIGHRSKVGYSQARIGTFSTAGGRAPEGLDAPPSCRSS